MTNRPVSPSVESVVSASSAGNDIQQLPLSLEPAMVDAVPVAQLAVRCWDTFDATPERQAPGIEGEAEDAVAYVEHRPEERRHANTLRAFNNGDYSKAMRPLEFDEMLQVDPQEELGVLSAKQYPRSGGTHPEDSEALYADPAISITVQQLRDYFKRTPRGKTPGPDGWTPDDFRSMVLPSKQAGDDAAPTAPTATEAALASLFSVIANAPKLAVGVRRHLSAAFLFSFGKPDPQYRIVSCALSASLRSFFSLFFFFSFSHRCIMRGRCGQCCPPRSLKIA